MMVMPGSERIIGKIWYNFGIILKKLRMRLGCCGWFVRNGVKINRYSLQSKIINFQVVLKIYWMTASATSSKSDLIKLNIMLNIYKQIGFLYDKNQCRLFNILVISSSPSGWSFVEVCLALFLVGLLLCFFCLPSSSYIYLYASAKISWFK